MDLLQKQQVTSGASRSDEGQTESTEEEERSIFCMKRKQFPIKTLRVTVVARQQGNNKRYRLFCELWYCWSADSGQLFASCCHYFLSL